MHSNNASFADVNHHHRYICEFSWLSKRVELDFVFWKHIFATLVQRDTVKYTYMPHSNRCANQLHIAQSKMCRDWRHKYSSCAWPYYWRLHALNSRSGSSVLDVGVRRATYRSKFGSSFKLCKKVVIHVEHYSIYSLSMCATYFVFCNLIFFLSFLPDAECGVRNAFWLFNTAHTAIGISFSFCSLSIDSSYFML